MEGKITFCDMHSPSGCGECPNRYICKKSTVNDEHKVVKCSWGGTRRDAGVSGIYDECLAFCQAMGWHLDEGYVWDLEIERVEG